MVHSVSYDSSIFPYVFDCAGCGDELHVTCEEAEEVGYGRATVRGAVDTVRRSKGWWIGGWDVRCPECITDLEDLGAA